MRGTLLFREGYTLQEKFDRINSKYFKWEIPEIRHTAEKHEIKKEELGSKSETRFVFSRELTGDEFEELIDKLFDKYGKRGEKFNFKIYKISEDADYDTLLENSQENEGTNLTETADLSRDVKLLKAQSHQGESIIDLLFVVKGTPDHLSGEELEVIDKDSGETIDAEEELEIKRPQQYQLESRVYLDHKLVGITKSRGPDNLRESLVDVIESWSESQ